MKVFHEEPADFLSVVFSSPQALLPFTRLRGGYGSSFLHRSHGVVGRALDFTDKYL